MSQARHFQLPIGAVSLVILQKPRRRQTGVRHHPLQQALALQARSPGDDLDLACKSRRIGASGQIRIADQIRVVIATLAGHPLGINRQPAPGAEIEDVVVVHITVQHHRFLR